MDFVIVCTGRYGDIPKMPTFEAGKGPEVFKGKAMHAMELYSMDKKQVDDLISAKKVVVVGFQKSAFDIAAKCAGTNGEGSQIVISVHFLIFSGRRTRSQFNRSKKNNSSKGGIVS